MLFGGLFKKENEDSNVAAKFARLREYGTPTPSIVTDIITKRTGWIVMAICEDRWLGTQTTYRSGLLKLKPKCYVGGEVIVYVDDASANGDYYVDC